MQANIGIDNRKHGYRLPQETVAGIISMYKSKTVTVRQVAERFNVAQSTVSRVLTRNKIVCLENSTRFSYAYNRVRNTFLDIPVMEQKKIYRLVGLELELIGK